MAAIASYHYPLTQSAAYLVSPPRYVHVSYMPRVRNIEVSVQAKSLLVESLLLAKSE